MPQGPRIARVSEEFREILAEEIPKLKDPRIGFVTVTGVKVTADLRRAWIYYTAFGDEKERASTRAGLRSARPRLRGVIGKQVRLKYLPELEFEEDATLEQAARIDRLIARIDVGHERPEDEPEDEPVDER
jgi:ribosome-binding factor A